MTVFEKMFSKYGNAVSFEKNGKTITVKALLQPLHYRFKTYFMPKRMPKGMYDNRHYLLLGPADFSAEPRQVISCGEKEYIIVYSEGCRVRGRTLFIRAILTACAEDTEDDYDFD